MTQQTAVDYLIKQISEILGPLKTEGMTDLLLVDAIQKAKQMEKEQIMKAAKVILFASTGPGDTAAEQYYNETYGKSNS